MSIQDCEGLAAYELDRLGIGSPVDPWDVVAAYDDVTVTWGEPGVRPHVEAHGDGTYTIMLDPAERRERVGLALLHELAHILLDAHGVENDEQHAWWLACAMLLPRDDMLRARRRGATVEELVAAHTWASHEAVARRLVTMSSSSILWVHDIAPHHRAPYKVVSPGWRWNRRRPTALEVETMGYALEERAAVELVGGVRAWPVIDDEWVRVLCLADAEVLLGHVSRSL